MSKVKLKTPEQRMAEAGRAIARRLSQPGRAQIVSDNGLTLYLVQDFMTLDECAALVQLIDQGRKPSELLAETVDPYFRTSDSCNLDPLHPMVAGIETRICTLMGVNARHGETLQGQVYEVGQQFKPHFDYFSKGAPYWDAMQSQGGQRSWTAMIYLNQPGAGGETHFPTASLKVSPRIGMLVLWSNMEASGVPNVSTLHEGMPVLAGTKYIVTKWFRERFWT
jgi:prolyl 4-hydroxylase